MVTNLCNSDTISSDFTSAMAAIHPDRVAAVPGSFNNRALIRIPVESDRVNLIVSAGGAGAPFPDSMVTCQAMADASVVGGKYAAPSAYDIYEAAKYIGSDKGYLLRSKETGQTYQEITVPNPSHFEVIPAEPGKKESKPRTRKSK